MKTQFKYRPTFTQFEVLFFADQYTAAIDINNNVESINPHQVGNSTCCSIAVDTV